MEQEQKEARLLYDRCVERARKFMEDAHPEYLPYYIENAEALDLGIWVGVTGAFIELSEEGLLD